MCVFAFSVFSVFSFLSFLWAPGGSRPLRRSLALVVPSCRFSSLPVALHSFSGLWRFVCSLRSLVALYPLICAQDVRFPSPPPGTWRAFVEATFSDLVHSALIQRTPFSPFRHRGLHFVAPPHIPVCAFLDGLCMLCQQPWYLQKPCPPPAWGNSGLQTRFASNSGRTHSPLCAYSV